MGLKDLDLDNAVVNVWVAQVNIRNKTKRFTAVKRLKVHDDALNQFKGYVTGCIDGYEHIAELRTINTSQDNRFFHIESTATDLTQLTKLVTEGDVETVANQSELNKFNAYAIQLTFGDSGNSIFAFRYISGAWSVSKTSGKFFGFETIGNELVVKIDSDHRFAITPYIDFIQLDDDVFIADVKQFEVAMNFHERLEEKKDEAITALCDSSAMLTASKDPLTKAIGTDKHLMRQLASVHDKGYYSNDLWLRRLRTVAEEAGNWKIKFNEDGKIIVEEDKEYVKELLTLLQNKRVKTVVDGVMFDVDGELIAIDTAEG